MERPHGGVFAAAARPDAGASARALPSNARPMTAPAHPLLDAPLRTAAGEPTTLRARLGPGPLVVVFLRHFG